MKKLLFIMILMQIGISCSGKQKGHERKMLNVVEKDAIQETFQNDSLIGTWNLSKTIMVKTSYKNGASIEAESSIVCNVCPIIIFKKNGVGILMDSKGNKSSFNWVINKDTIYFTFDKKNDESLFFSLDKEFKFKTYSNPKEIFLELGVIEKNYKYVLVKIN